MSCNNCNTCSCGSTKGERGLQGPQGAQGVPGPAGPAGGGIGNKFNFFAEVQVNADVSGTTFYHPVGYDVLSWTNNTGAQIILMAQCNAQSEMNGADSDDTSNVIDMAIIKTVLAVDSWSVISQMDVDFRGGLFDAVDPFPGVDPGWNIPIKINTTPPKVVLTEDAKPIEFRFGQAFLRSSASLMKKVILNDGETVSVKFKSKATNQILNSGQLFLQQLDM